MLAGLRRRSAAASRRCITRSGASTLCEEHGLGDWDLAYAFEALARAHASPAMPTMRRRYRSLAREAGDAIRDPEDREHFDEDFATL